MNATADLIDGMHALVGDILPERPHARFLPGVCYVSPAVAEQEKARIFMKSWLCVAREEELPEVGDYRTLRICDEPVLLSRGPTGELTASLNMCLHSGVEVAYGAGNARAFSCPYHAWTYDCGGKLIGTPLVKRDVAGQLEPGLRRLQLATWRGWIFINFDPHAQPFAEFIKPIDEDLGYYRTGECRLADKIEFTVECNWKFFAENICDYYHLKAVHGQSSGQFYALGEEELPLRPYPGGSSSVLFDSSLRKRDTILPFPALPWLAEHAFSAKGAIFPNINFWCGLDSLRMWHIWPVAPGRTHAVCYVLMPPESFEVPDFASKLETYRKYVRQIIEEDTVTIGSLQRAAATAHYRTGPITHLESMVHHLMRHYAEVMTR